MRKVISFFGLVALVLVIVLSAGRVGDGSPWFDARQLGSIAVFATFICGTLMFGEFRLAFAFGGIAALMAANLLTVEQFVLSASLDVIIFLIGTFLVIGFLEENQFFEHIVAGLVRAVGPRPQVLLASMMFMASISSALVGEVTAILFMAGALMHLTGKYRLNPTPFVIMLVFSCNVGSAMTAVGNPIGVLIALKTGLGFLDFLRWAVPIALVVDVVTYLLCRWWFAKEFAQFKAAVEAEAGPQPLKAADQQQPSPLEPKSSQLLCWVILAGLIGLLVTHSLIEDRFGLRPGTMMVAAPLIMGCIVLLIARERARLLVERRVDWWTLCFFMMLFASVGTLEHTGVTGVIAQKLIASTGGNQFLLINLVGWATGWLSAFLDNVLAVATFMPVVHDVRLDWARQNPSNPGYPQAIYWLMLFGGTFMGNMTVIGSTANIIAVGLLEKRGHGTVRFGYWFKIGLIVSIASMGVATLLLGIQTSWFSSHPLAPPMTMEQR